MTTAMPDLFDADQINDNHRREWHEAMEALGLDPADPESCHKVPRDTRNAITERTRQHFVRLVAHQSGRPLPDDPETTHAKRSANYDKAFAWVTANLGVIMTLADMAKEADVPDSAMRSVEERNPAWFKRLSSRGVFQIVNGNRCTTAPQETSDATVASVAAMMAKIMGHQ